MIKNKFLLELQSLITCIAETARFVDSVPVFISWIEQLIRLFVLDFRYKQKYLIWAEIIYDKE